MHSTSLRHHAKRKQKEKGITVNSHLARMVDVVVYPIGITGVLMTLPQLYEIWIVGNASGVSSTSWIAWWIIAGFWIFYGTIHKTRALVVINIGNFLLNGLVVLGIYLHT